jgi:hypothetical protein
MAKRKYRNQMVQLELCAPASTSEIHLLVQKENQRMQHAGYRRRQASKQGVHAKQLSDEENLPLEFVFHLSTNFEGAFARRQDHPSRHQGTKYGR